jgi:hypothetical protein
MDGYILHKKATLIGEKRDSMNAACQENIFAAILGTYAIGSSVI